MPPSVKEEIVVITIGGAKMKVLKILFSLAELFAAICLIVKVSLMTSSNMSLIQIFAVINMLGGVFGLMFDVGMRTSKAVTQLIKK